MRNLISFKTALRLTFVAMLLVMPFTQNAYSSGQSVHLESINVAPDGTSVRINLDGQVKTKIFNLDNPPRWVLDITPAKWSAGVERNIKPANDKYFGQVRTGQWQTSTARLVIHTRGSNPDIEIQKDSILITFVKNTSENESKSETIKPLASTAQKQPPVIQIPRVDKSELPDTAVLPVVDKSKEDMLTVKSKDQIKSNVMHPTGSGSKDESSERPDFEIMSDGGATVIQIPLIGDNSFDVRRERFPDRLTIEYPSRKTVANGGKILYQALGKENMPIGVIEYCTRYRSENIPGYNKLMFYTQARCRYQTTIDNGILKIEVSPKESRSASENATDSEIAKLESTKEIPAKFQPVQLQTLETPARTKADEKKAETVQVNLLEQTPEANDEEIKSEIDNDNRKLTPPEKKRPSFVIDMPEKGETDANEHTTPESALGTLIKSEETSNEYRQASVKEMTKFLPEYANSALNDGSKALASTEAEPESNIVAGSPLMFDPPENPKQLPKGSRPAADLFLTKGESVILPASALIRASVGDPEVLIVNVLSQEELLITAKDEGRTTLIIWEDGIGRSVRWVNVSTSSLLKTMNVDKVINNPAIKVSFVGDKTIVLEGKVKTEEEKNRAVEIAKGAVESKENVVDLIEISDPRQVLVKVRFVEIQTKDKNEMLKQFGTGSRTQAGDFQFNVLTDVLNPEFATGGVFDISMHPSILKGNSKSGDLRFDALDMMLTALEQSRCGRILSQPNLVTLSGHPAEFRVGGEIPYTYQNENGFNVVDFREFGVELKILPVVDSQNNINLKLEPSVRVPDFTLAIAGIPGFKTRLVSTRIQVGDSQTIVIGGLLQHEVTEIKSKVPILGDVPLLGELFRSKTKSDEETELLIFLTPMVIKDISSVEGSIKSEEDVSLSPYYHKEVVEAFKEED